MRVIKKLLLSVGLGAIATTLFLLIAFAAPQFTGPMLGRPGEALLHVLFHILPDSILTWIAGEEGGPEAAMRLIGFAAILFWWVAFGVAFWFFLGWQSKRRFSYKGRVS